MNSKHLAIFVALLTFQIQNAQFTDQINSNRPSESMSAYSVGKRVLQLENGFNFINDKHKLLKYEATGFFDDFALRYGFLKEELEFITEISYQQDKYTQFGRTEDRTGMKSTSLGLKYLLYDRYKYEIEKPNIYSWKANHKFKWNQLIPSVSIYGGFNLNFESKFIPKDQSASNVSPKAMLITHNVFGGGYIFIANVFFDKISTKRQSIGYVITLTKSFNDKWSMFFENKAIDSDYYADGIFSSGAAFLINDNIQIDASISKNIKDTPNLIYGGFGISWRTTKNYKDVLVRVNKEDKKEKKKGKKSKAEKEKEKSKKRLDEVEVTKP